MLPKSFKPRYLYDLTRIGSKNDGGYLIEKGSLKKSSYLVSIGVGGNADFEYEFSKKTRAKVIGFDDQVGLKYWIKYLLTQIYYLITRIYGFKKFLIEIGKFFTYLKLFTFNKNNMVYKEFIGSKNEGLKSLKEIIIENNIKELFFLKIDIEGNEYRIFDEIYSLINQVSGIAIEFHDVDLHIDKILAFINFIPLELVHIHGNNYSGKRNNIPLTLELTFSKNPENIGLKPAIPSKNDSPNNFKIKDLELEFFES